VRAGGRVQADEDGWKSLKLTSMSSPSSARHDAVAPSAAHWPLRLGFADREPKSFRGRKAPSRSLSEPRFGISVGTLGALRRVRLRVPAFIAALYTAKVPGLGRVADFATQRSRPLREDLEGHRHPLRRG